GIVFDEVAQERGGGPAFAVALVPAASLALDLGDADAVGPVHQAAAVAREAEAVEPHHVDVAGAVGFALFEDLAGFVYRGEQEPAQDLLVREAALRHPHFGRLFLDDAGDFGVGMSRAVALFVAEPAGPGLLPEPPRFDDRVGDRQFAVVRVLCGAPLAAVIADV